MESTSFNIDYYDHDDLMIVLNSNRDLQSKSQSSVSLFSCCFNTKSRPRKNSPCWCNYTTKSIPDDNYYFSDSSEDDYEEYTENTVNEEKEAEIEIQRIQTYIKSILTTHNIPSITDPRRRSIVLLTSKSRPTEDSVFILKYIYISINNKSL